MHITTYDHAPRLPEGETIDLDALVPGEGGVFLEVGPGRGGFALGYAALHPTTRKVATFLVHPGFPVDIRHNAKIGREQVAVWALARLP